MVHNIPPHTAVRLGISCMGIENDIADRRVRHSSAMQHMSPGSGVVGNQHAWVGWHFSALVHTFIGFVFA